MSADCAEDAKVSIMTHAFMYGTATFEGIRGYWNAEHQQLYVLFVREHCERIRNSAKMLLMEGLPSVDDLVAIVMETVRRNGYREDIYVRPSFYKSTKAIGVRLHHLEHQLYVITSPQGLDAAALAAAPESGSLFQAAIGRALGLPESRVVLP